MKIEFDYCEAESLEQDIENLQNFKNRWIELLAGWGEIEPESDCEITGAILSAEKILKELLIGLQKHEELNLKTQSHEI